MSSLTGYIFAAILANATAAVSLDSGWMPGKGLVLGLYADRDSYSYETQLREISEIGADSVCLIVRGFVEDLKGTTIELNDRGVPSEERLRTTIHQAHELDLQILLMPIILLRKTRGDAEWRGSIQPVSWNAWFASYQAFILHYARMAEEEDVDGFSVGSELCTSEKHTESWRDIIREVRKVYNGSLLYSANWDHFQNVDFEDDLDLLGITGYGNLHAEGETPSVEFMKNRWLEIRREIAAWSDRWHRKVVITEVGYASQKGITAHPWNYYGSRKVDMFIQDQAYQAFFEAWQDEPGLAGVFIYDWWGKGGVKDTGYTARGKLAERRLRAWFSED